MKIVVHYIDNTMGAYERNAEMEEALQELYDDHKILPRANETFGVFDDERTIEIDTIHFDLHGKTINYYVSLFDIDEFMELEE